MAFQVEYDRKDQIIVSHLQGDFDWSVVEQMVPELSKLIKEEECFHILLDFQASQVKMSTIQIYMTPEKLASEFSKYGVNILGLTRAMILAKNDANYHFLETVTYNKNQTLRIFLDQDLARKWLKEDD